jgi:redox-sensitive bicupin YhaK (pirin superfamily)
VDLFFDTGSQISSIMQKRIEHILSGREKQITPEEKVRQSLPHQDFRFANPFIVLHHMGPEEIMPGGQLRIHPHPHRGFAPVTFQLQGEGYHKDSAGHDETIHAGDVQWMFAGKGILHSEGPTTALLLKGGTQELIQLWINVPAVNKWDEPSYQSAAKAIQPHVLEQEGVNLRLVSGSYEGKTGPLKSFTPIMSIVGEIQKGKRVQFTATPGYWTLLYVIRGVITINCETVSLYNLIVFEKENQEIIITAEEDTQVLFLSAEPINEPVAAKDNFVMNTKEEIEQASEDYKNGIFGSMDY